MRFSRRLFAVAAVAAALSIAAGLRAQTSSPVQYAHHRTYQLVDLGTLGGPNSWPNLYYRNLNNRGTAVMCADTSVLDPKYPNFNPLMGTALAPLPDPSLFHAAWNQGSSPDLGALPGSNSSCGFWISDNDWVAGASLDGRTDPFLGWPAMQAVAWRSGQLITLGNFGGYESQASGVNNRGQVVGFSTNTVPDSDSGFGVQIRAFLWQNGVMRDLSTIGGPTTTDAFAIMNNDRGQVLGISFGSGPAAGTFLWDNGRTDFVVDAFGGTDTSPFYLNNRGMIVGHAGLPGDQVVHPYVWSKGVMTDLGTFGGSNGEAVLANDAGEVIGTADFPGDVKHEGFLWRHGLKTEVPPVHGDLCTRVWGLNSHSQVVGTSSDCTNGLSAILWENGESVDLNDLIDSDFDLTLVRGTDINDRGEILAQAVYPTGVQHAVLLVPHGDCDEACERLFGQRRATRRQRVPASENFERPGIPLHTRSLY